MFAELNGLCAAAGAQLVEGPAAVSLDGVLADEEAVGDLTIAQPLRDERENFELARRDPERVKLRLIQGEGGRWCFGRDKDFAQDDCFARLGEFDPEPDPKAGEEDGDQGGIDFERVLDHEELVLRPAEDGDENAADETEDEDVALHGC